MESSKNEHPELSKGEILFCYVTQSGFDAIGPELRQKLRRGTFVPENFRPSRGTLREDHFPCFAKIADLDAETLRILGYNANAAVPSR